jgi:hypothetical protein
MHSLTTERRDGQAAARGDREGRLAVRRGRQRRGRQANRLHAPGEVAEAIGISIDGATVALHELHSLGYAREEKRRYWPTEEGVRVRASLARARRKALAAFLSALSEEDRRHLTNARTDQGEG